MKLRFSYQFGLRALRAALATALTVSAAVGAYISATDAYLWSAAPSHAYGLIVFIGADLVVAVGLYLLPRLGRVAALLIPAVELAAMAGDLYTGLASPGSSLQAAFRTYLLNDTAFLVLLLLQAVLVGMAFGYLAQPRAILPGSQGSLAENTTARLGA